MVKKKIGRPTTYKPEYAKMIVEFFSPPYYLIKDMTITRPDGTQIDNTKLEALPPIFLSDFARSIGVSNIHYRQIFSDWAKKNKDYSDALKEAKGLEVERYRVNGSLHLYNPAFAIFTLKNIAGWRDKQEIEHSGEVKGQTVVLIQYGKSGNDTNTSKRVQRQSISAPA